MWIKVKDTEGNFHLLNTEHIIDVEYIERTDLTMFTVSRSAFPSIYVNGETALKELKILLNREGSLHSIGE